MAYKTIYRAAYNDVIIDSQKIDAQFASLSNVQDEFNHEPANTTEDVKHEIVNETASQDITFELQQPQENPAITPSPDF
jgi:hypothetical protein